MKRFIFISIFFLFFFAAPETFAASLHLRPETSSASVGSTFTVSVRLNTEGKSVNALSVKLTFPADKLQVVNPAVGQSIVGVWTVPPKYNNAAGTIEFEGGIPKGVNTTNGVLTNITFRVKSVGDAIVRFQDDSSVFLNDGLATNDLRQTENGIYSLKLPPPGGPIVVSSTHPDQAAWYAIPDAELSFENNNAVEGYSYVLSPEPITVPDNISEGMRHSVSYSGLADGIHYFHVKALRGGAWGGTTHFAIKIDTEAPAEIPLEILPGSRTVSQKPVIQFETTDAASGLNHYELRIEPLSFRGEAESTFFVDAVSPYISGPLELGSYNVMVRAYDNAGNMREVTKKLTVTTTIFSFLGDRGIQIKNTLIISWTWVWAISMVIILILLFIAYRTWYWHKGIHKVHEEKLLPQEVVSQLEELKKYREKYGKALAIAFIIFSLFSFNKVEAQIKQNIPPLITTFSQNITNKEIFYVGGRAGNAEETVVLYTQNLETGEAFSTEIASDAEGEWFYRHNAFLQPGDYLMWVQARQGEQYSPPSSQVTLSVERAAIQFGANRLSYEAIYLTIIVLLLVAITGLALFISYHYYHGRRKHYRVEKQIRDAEESVRRGFAVLRRDIEEELAMIRKSTMGPELALEEKHKEAELLNDLNFIQQRIGREIWEVKNESW